MNTLGPSPPATLAQPGEPATRVRNNTAEEAAEAARQFEAIFVRNLLSSLETSEAFGGSKAGGSGSDIYGSMMVSALAESATQGDGMGLSEIVLRALSSSPSGPTGPATDK